MPSYLRLVWLLLGLASMVALIALFLIPATWTVEREVVVDAPPEAIWPWIVDLERWPEWSPWQEGAYEGVRASRRTRAAGWAGSPAPELRAARSPD